ncbi:MAG: N-acetylmuramoyl-L-alanine [Prolixibacteraceae bacterium]|nr:MAG: N-acetylmuramoyl-L-alanine [Prolixibacteraceae bacterium]
MKNTFLNFILVCSLILISAPFARGKYDYTGNTEEKRISVVVIDPGHGGKDFGASVGNAKEKDIVLDLALRLGNSIRAKYPEIKVIYTRTKDVFIPLYKRADIANKNKADLFISIHVNGTDKTSVQGTETFVLGQHRSKENLEVAKKENSVILLEDDYNTKYEGFDPNSPESYIMFELVQDEYLEQSVMFASAIQNQFRQYAKRIDRSVKQAGFLVLRQTAMPSVLVEVGFISHPNERRYMVSEKGKAALSASIFNAFADYKTKIENKSSFSVHTETGSLKSTSTTANSGLISSSETKTEESVKSSSLFFSVQIAASSKKMETTPSNFKGEKNIFRVDAKDISRYYSGKFQTLHGAENEKKRIQGKFPESFVVAFENNELISVKKALEKM